MKYKGRLFIFCIVWLASISNALYCAKQKQTRRHSKSITQQVPAPTLDGLDHLGSHRNLIIIQDDYNETNGCLHACTITLLQALQAAAAPILVSKSLWFNMCLYLRQYDNTHFLKPKKKQWQLYRVNQSAYLAIPKQYKKKAAIVSQHFKLPQPIIDATTGNALTHEDIVLGLKCSKLKEVSSPFSCTFTQLVAHRAETVGSLFSFNADVNTKLLHSIFITRDEIANIESYPAWDIFLVGHGKTSRIFNSQLAGFSVSEFRALLGFLHNAIHTNALVYQTCFGGGKHLTIPYTTKNEADCYNYAIICCCTSASPATVMHDPFSKHNTDFNAMFKDITNHSSADNFEQRLASFFPNQHESPKKRLLHNIPSIRLPQSTEFVALGGPSTEETLQVYKPEAANNETIIIDNKLAFLLYDHGIIHTPIVMKGSCAALIPMHPEADTVIIDTLDAREQTLHDISLYCFTPISMVQAPTGTYLIKELLCKRHEDDTSYSTLRNVMISSNRTTPLLETAYEQELEQKYLYNFLLRKKVTYELDGKTYKRMIKPAQGPDILGKTLLVAALIFGLDPAPLMEFAFFVHDNPKQKWTIGKAQQLTAKHARRYHGNFMHAYNATTTKIVYPQPPSIMLPAVELAPVEA